MIALIRFRLRDINICFLRRKQKQKLHLSLLIRMTFYSKPFQLSLLLSKNTRYKKYSLGLRGIPLWWNRSKGNLKSVLISSGRLAGFDKLL